MNAYLKKGWKNARSADTVRSAARWRHKLRIAPAVSIAWNHPTGMSMCAWIAVFHTVSQNSAIFADCVKTVVLRHLIVRTTRRCA